MIASCTIFLVYFFLLLLLITKLSFVKKSGLTTRWTVALFSAKIITGIVATWYGYTGSGDLYASHLNSIQETAILKTNPLQFFTSLLQSGYSDYGGLYSTHSFWNDLRYVFMDKLLAILNLLPFSTIYINVLVYNAVIFLAHVTLYRVFISVWPEKKWQVIAGCFLMPGSLFFLSTVNKDSMFFLAVSMVMYALYLMPDIRNIRVKPVLLLLSGVALMFIIRNFFMLAALPALFSFYIYPVIKTKPVYVYSIVLSIVVVTIFTSPEIMTLISNRQKDFLLLGYAKSLVAVPELEPHFRSFFAYLPHCINIVFLQPFAWHAYNLFYLLSGLEMMFFQLVLITATVYVFKNKSKKLFHPLVLFGVFFSITAFIIIGYTIPFLGAAIRYKSAFIPLLLTPLLCMLPVEKFITDRLLQKKMMYHI